MKRLIECIPNISDGINPNVLESVLEALEMPGVTILGTYIGNSTNRTVITYVAEPEIVSDSAIALMRATSNFIDMRVHKGSHPRIGATDVFPLVPLRGVTMDECVKYSREIGKRAADELGIPIYLYSHSAVRPERKLLSACRKGQYESINSRIGDPYWTPDYGFLTSNSSTGATVVGARDFLIAYNINLTTKDKTIADAIAARLRESGSLGRSGIFREVSAIGWYLDEYQIAQISTNIRDYRVSPPHRIYEEASKLAIEFGCAVNGSELIGLIPEEALILAGQSSKISGGTRDVAERGADYLGLSSLTPFRCEDRIVERVLKKFGL